MAEPVWQYVASRFTAFLNDLAVGASVVAATDAARRDVEVLLCRWLKVRSAASRGASDRCLRLPPTRIVGGFATATGLAGNNTIDLLLMLDEEVRPPMVGRGAALPYPRAVHRITDLLGQRYGAVQIDAQGWIRLHTDRLAEDGPVQVRLLPAFCCAGGGVLVAAPRRKAGAPWRQLDPDAHRRRLDHADRVSHGKARHLVRLVKSWRRTVDAPLSGFAIEILVCEFLSVWIYRRRSLLFYDWMVRDFFFWLATQGDQTLPAPGTLETLPLGNRWLPAARRAYITARTAADLERENDSVAALGQWREIFGLGFCGNRRSGYGTDTAAGTVSAVAQLRPLPLRRNA